MDVAQFINEHREIEKEMICKLGDLQSPALVVMMRCNGCSQFSTGVALLALGGSELRKAVKSGAIINQVRAISSRAPCTHCKSMPNWKYIGYTLSYTGWTWHGLTEKDKHEMETDYDQWKARNIGKRKEAYCMFVDTDGHQRMITEEIVRDKEGTAIEFKNKSVIDEGLQGGMVPPPTTERNEMTGYQ